MTAIDNFCKAYTPFWFGIFFWSLYIFTQQSASFFRSCSNKVEGRFLLLSSFPCCNNQISFSSIPSCWGEKAYKRKKHVWQGSWLQCQQSQGEKVCKEKSMWQDSCWHGKSPLLAGQGALKSITSKKMLIAGVVMGCSTTKS